MDLIFKPERHRKLYKLTCEVMVDRDISLKEFKIKVRQTGEKFIRDMKKQGYNYMGDTQVAKDKGLPGLQISGPRPYIERPTSLLSKKDLYKLPVEVKTTQNLFIPTQYVSYFLHGLFAKVVIPVEVLVTS